MERYALVIKSRLSGETFKVIVYYTMRGRVLEFEADIVSDNVLHDTHLVTAFGTFDGKKFTCYEKVVANLVSEEGEKAINNCRRLIEYAVKKAWCKEIRNELECIVTFPPLISD